MSTDESHAAALKAYFDGINQERYEDVAALFAPDAELNAPGIETLRGPDAIAGYFAAALRRYPEHLDDPGRILHSGDSATVEIHFTGCTDTGIAIEFDAVDVFDFDPSGRIVRLSSWYDSHAVREALRRPTAGARVEGR